MSGLKISSAEIEKCLFYLTDRRFNLLKCTRIKFRWIKKSSVSSFFLFFCHELMKICLSHTSEQNHIPNNYNLKLWLCVCKTEKMGLYPSLCQQPALCPGDPGLYDVVSYHEENILAFSATFPLDVWC